MNEDTQMTTGWRDQAPSADLRAKTLARVSAKPRRTTLTFLGLGLVGSGAAAAVLSTMTLFASAPVTLAQVMNADENAESITIVNKRIMGPDKGNGFTVTTKSVGKYFLTTITDENGLQNFGYTDGTEKVSYYGIIRMAAMDGQSNKLDTSFRRPKISAMLKSMKQSKIEENFDWNGRKVTRFTCKMKVRGTDVDQELFVDPKTQLPIRFVSMRDNRSWGDEWTYDYSPIDPASLKPKIPDGTKVVDNRKVRAPFPAWVKRGSSIPFAEFGPSEFAILVDRSLIDRKKFQTPYECTFTDATSKKHSFKGNFTPLMSPSVQIGGKSFAVIVYSHFPGTSEDFTLNDTVSGSVKIAGKTIPFNNIPVAKTATVYMLNSPFSDAYYAKHPNEDERVQRAKWKARQKAED